jgi:hypothetical protein
MQRDTSGADDRRLGPKRAGEAERRGFVVFADESATSPGYPCYGIGALIVPAERLDAFNEYVRHRLVEHGVVGEAKWSKVGNSHGLINFAVQLWRDILNHPDARFAAIVVDKRRYRNWAVAHEPAFYKTYTLLLRHVARLRAGDFEVVIDHRSDAYPRNDEVVGIVSNHMLRQIQSGSSIVRVTKNNSKMLPGLQVVDLFTGAITHAHAMGLDTKVLPNPSKLLLMERMAAGAGWRDLYCDTMPNSAVNIWHFPEEWRAVPETREVLPTRSAAFVTAGDVRAARR